MSVQATMTLRLDVNTTTLDELVNRILKTELAFNQPQVMRDDRFAVPVDVVTC
jgi:hypothetical protein